MQSFFNKHKFVLLTFLVAFIVLFCFYSAVILAPNDFLFAPTGDGIKNYYAFIYHAQYDSSFNDFSGMNYPYYEHIVYTDAHPLLSYLIGQLSLANYAVGILNLFMLISFPIGAVFLYKILAHYRVNVWFAIAAAICIAFLSPQIFRMGGHLSLSYVFAIPIMWWLLIKCVTGKRWVWSVITSIYLIAFFFTHPYLGMILVFFSVFFWLIRMILIREGRWSNLGHICLQAAIPIIGFQLYVNWTDTHIDRLSNPAGFFDLYASWRSLLVPHHGPLHIDSEFFNAAIGNWESWSYIGFSTILFLGFIGAHSWLRRKSIDFRGIFKNELILFLLAAYIILLFSFCFPLKYSWLRWITDLIGPLKQFRVLGRFTWIFYYVITVSAVVGVYKIYLIRQNKRILYLLSFGLLFSVAEFIPAHVDMAKSITQSSNSFKIEEVQPDLQEAIQFVNLGDYDAILFLPFEHMSSENIMILGAGQANFDAFLMSYHTQLPLMNSMTSRMSLSEAIRFNTYFSPGFIEKELTYDLPKDAKIALVKNKDLLKISELRMIWESELIFENETYLIFNFDQEKWNSPERFNTIVEREKLANIDLGKGWRSDTTDVWFYYESFDTCKNDLPQSEILGGSSAYSDLKNSWNILVSFENGELLPGDYVVRFWYYLLVDRPDIEAVVEAKYESGDSAKWIAQCDVKQATVIVENWCLVEMEFTVEQEMELVNFLIAGNGNKQRFVVDEFLLQKQGERALFKEEQKGNESYIIYNNYWLKENSFETKRQLYPRE